VPEWSVIPAATALASAPEMATAAEPSVLLVMVRVLPLPVTV
jgi:hypothetical protein